MHDNLALDSERKEHFYHLEIRQLFVAKRARPNMQPPVTFLCTWVQKSTEEAWFEPIHSKWLSHIESQQFGHCEMVCRCSVLQWHHNMKSHTIGAMTRGEGDCVGIQYHHGPTNTLKVGFYGYGCGWVCPSIQHTPLLCLLFRLSTLECLKHCNSTLRNLRKSQTHHHHFPVHAWQVPFPTPT